MQINYKFLSPPVRSPGRDVRTALDRIGSTLGRQLRQPRALAAFALALALAYGGGLWLQFLRDLVGTPTSNALPAVPKSHF